jgi:hypothetical protein
MTARALVRGPHVSDPLDVPLRPISMRSAAPRHTPQRQVAVVDRVKGEFVEMRGFSPTVEQAARLFDLTTDACRDVLSSLVREGFLTRTSDGRYRLPHQG